MNLLIAIAFGPMALGAAFLIFVFTRAYLDPAKHLDRRYRVVALSLAIGQAGVLLWAFNPLSQAFGGPPLHWILMGVASALILISASTLIGSTAMGGNPRLLRWFLLISLGWVGCLLVSRILL
jgi:hypothetical protein